MDDAKQKRRAEVLYMESLRAIKAELLALRNFAYDFKGTESTGRLNQAITLIVEEIKND